MSFNISYGDLIKIIKAFGHDYHTTTVVADYLDECIDYEMDLTHYLWNTLLYNVQCFNTKEEALQYIDDENLNLEDCTLYECDNYDGVYLQY